jgi:hypothetical protein
VDLIHDIGDSAVNDADSDHSAAIGISGIADFLASHVCLGYDLPIRLQDAAQVMRNAC